jgi:hypothetical protein
MQAAPGPGSEPSAEAAGECVQRRSSLSWKPSGTTKALLASPVVLLLMTATRLVIISNYDTTTAISIASNSGAVNTLLGTAIPLLPPLLPPLFLALVLLRKGVAAVLSGLAMLLVSPAYTDVSSGASEVRARATAFVDWVSTWKQWFETHVESFRTTTSTLHAGIALYQRIAATFDLATVLSDWRVQSVVYVFLAVVLARRRAKQWRGLQLGVPLLRHRAYYAILPVTMGLLCFATLAAVDEIYYVPRDPKMALVSLRQPWLPAEIFTEESGKSYVGYALSTKDDWDVILDEPSRTIRLVHAGDMKTRMICQVSGTPVAERLPAIALLKNVPDQIGRCPTMMPENHR